MIQPRGSRHATNKQNDLIVISSISGSDGVPCQFNRCLFFLCRSRRHWLARDDRDGRCQSQAFNTSHSAIGYFSPIDVEERDVQLADLILFAT
jgi:hypothetical protein